jgi:hypothetical protein
VYFRSRPSRPEQPSFLAKPIRNRYLRFLIVVAFIPASCADRKTVSAERTDTFSTTVETQPAESVPSLQFDEIDGTLLTMQSVNLRRIGLSGHHLVMLHATTQNTANSDFSIGLGTTAGIPDSDLTADTLAIPDQTNDVRLVNYAAWDDFKDMREEVRHSVDYESEQRIGFSSRRHSEPTWMLLDIDSDEFNVAVSVDSNFGSFGDNGLPYHLTVASCPIQPAAGTSEPTLIERKPDTQTFTTPEVLDAFNCLTTDKRTRALFNDSQLINLFVRLDQAQNPESYNIANCPIAPSIGSVWTHYGSYARITNAGTEIDQSGKEPTDPTIFSGSTVEPIDPKHVYRCGPFLINKGKIWESGLF